MRRTWGVVLVLGLVIVASVGAATQADEYDCPVDTEDVQEPGEELANVVGDQESVVAREIERRGFNATLADADDPDERATVIATELDRIELRLTDLETCREALVEAREDDDLTAEEYRERATTLDRDVEDVRERLNHTEAAASDLTPEVREENDADEDRFDELGERVEDLETFVAEPDQAIESADSGSDSERTGPPQDKSAGEAATTPSEPPDDAPGQATETPTTEDPDDENEKGENEKGKNGDGASEPGDDSGKAGTNYG